MMINKILPAFLAIFISCANMTNSDKNKQEDKDTSEKVRSNISTSTPQQGMLLGKFQEKDLMAKPYSSWFEPKYKDYEPDKEAMETIKNNISDYDITIYMGTWCHDSKRETPKLFKLLDKVGYDKENLTAIAVDYSKTTPKHLEKDHNITRVPTIIFYKNGKEVNRFVEFAQQSLEEDIAKIVSGKDYKNSYAKK